MKIRRFVKYITQPEHFFALFLKYFYEKKYGKGLKVGLFTSIKNVKFGQNVYLSNNINISDTSIDDYSYSNDNSSIKNAEIGKFTSIGSHVRFGTGKHPTHFVSTHPIFYANNKGFLTFSNQMHFDETPEKIYIGNDVWIGSGVLIKDGLTVGDGAIIAAHAVVTKDVAPYAIVGGIPAKVIRFRFNEEVIKKLLELQWWNYPVDTIKKHYLKFLNTTEFFDFFGQ